MRPLAINRTNDAVFKTIFANEKHKDITLSLINAVFEFEGTGQIQDITFLDRELDAEFRSLIAIRITGANLPERLQGPSAIDFRQDHAQAALLC